MSLDTIKSHSWRIQSCSAVTGKNLLQGLDWTVKEVSQRVYYSSTIGWSAIIDTGPVPGLIEFDRKQTVAT